MSVGFETLSGIISSAVENWITNTLDEKAKAFFDKEKIDAFRQDIEKDVREYINFHDGTVLTTGAFETFLSKYNVVESFFSYVSGGSTPASKDELIKIFSKLFIESGTVRKQVSWESKQRIHDFWIFCTKK